MNKLDICGYDAANLDHIKIHKEDLVKVRRMPWEPVGEKLSILMTGSMFPAGGISKVTVSLNGGRNHWRALGEDPFTFSFVPLDGNVYPVVINFYDRRENVIFAKKIEIEYSSVIWDEFFNDKIEAIRRDYINKNMFEFTLFFDDSEYPSFAEFVDDIQSTLDDYSNIRLSMTVKSVTVEGDKATVVLDWHKTFEDDYSQEGTDSVIGFKKRKGAWKIFSVSDDTMFVIGAGRVNVTY
ncbi:hypothetical protein ACFL2Y_02885 [Candidatus Omnitrophota bacterium]